MYAAVLLRVFQHIYPNNDATKHSISKSSGNPTRQTSSPPASDGQKPIVEKMNRRQIVNLKYVGLKME